MQSLVVDLDSGDIPAKLDHLVHHLGRPTLIVESGGRTPEGATKLHVWWKLTEPAEGADLDRLCQLRGEIALKVGGDTHFRSAHQPIRVPGTVYHKGGLTRLVQIREATELEVDLAEMAERVADMPPMPGIGMATAEPREKPAIDDVLVTPVHEGGADDWSRFEGASAAIGYFLRLVHEGRISMDEGWTAICGYNAAMLRPSWPLDRLKRETNRLWELHIKRHGPPLIRLDSAAPSADRSADLHSGRAPRRHEPHARRHHRTARADARRAPGAGRRAQGGQERSADRVARAHGGGRAVPRLHAAAAAADLLPAGRDPVPLPARAHAADRPAAE
jgi:hypothetical protein